jgi:putative heme iron utilization protein
VKLELYQRVALCRDLPIYQLKKGDVAMLVDRVPHPNEGEDGCVLEIFNALGESILVVAVSRSDVELLRADEVLSVRSLVQAS